MWLFAELPGKFGADNLTGEAIEPSTCPVIEVPC